MPTLQQKVLGRTISIKEAVQLEPYWCKKCQICFNKTWKYYCTFCLFVTNLHCYGGGGGCLRFFFHVKVDLESLRIHFHLHCHQSGTQLRTIRKMCVKNKRCLKAPVPATINIHCENIHHKCPKAEAYSTASHLASTCVQMHVYLHIIPHCSAHAKIQTH